MGNIYVAVAKGRSQLIMLGDRVLIKTIQPPDQQGNVIIPEQAQDIPQRGVVMSIGEGTWDGQGNCRPIPLQVGDEVLYGKYAGSEVTLEGEKFLICRQDDLLALFIKPEE